MATEAVQLQPLSESLKSIAQNYEDVIATDNSSSSHSMAEDEASNSAEVGKLNSPKGEIIIEPPTDIQFSLKETDVQHVNIVSKQIEDEGYLTGNNNNIEAQTETDGTAHTLMEEATSDMDVLAKDEGRTTYESASQKTLYQNDEAQSEEKKNESHDRTETEKVKRVDENKHARIETERGIPNDENTDGSDGMPVAEHLQYLEATTQKDPDPAETESVDEKSEGPLNLVPKDKEKKKNDRTNEDIHVKMEVETGRLNEEGIQGINSISATEPAENDGKQEASEIAQPLDDAAGEEFEPADDEPEDGKLNIPFNVIPKEPDEENIKKANEEKHEKIEAESGMYSEESANCKESISVAEPSEEENREEPLETTTNEDPESPEDELDCGKFESPLDPISMEPEAGVNEELSQEKNAHCLETINKKNIQPAKDEPDGGKPEANEDVKIEVETSSHGRDIHNILEAEPSEQENLEEPPETTEAAGNKQERGEVESPLGAVSKGLEPENLQKVCEESNAEIVAKIGGFSDDNVIDNKSVAQPSEKEIKQETIEITTGKDCEPAGGEHEVLKLEVPVGAVPKKSEAKFERIYEDEHVEMEAETGGFNDKRENDTHSVPVRKFPEKLIKQEPLEIAAIENVKSSEDETGVKLEQPLDALPEEPELTMPSNKLPDSSLQSGSSTAKAEIEATCIDKLVINAGESSPEDDNRYSAITKVESESLPGYQKTRASALSNETETTNEENESSTEYDIVKRTTCEGDELQKDAPSSTSELSQSINKDIYPQETEPDPDEASQPAFQEHDNSYDTVADSKATGIDMNHFREANEDSSTSHASEEDQIWETTEPKAAKEQIYADNKKNKVHARNIDWQTELTVETETHEKTEKIKSMETTPETSSLEQTVAENLNDDNELEQGKESYKAVADGDNLEEIADEKTLNHVLQKETLEDELENTSKGVEKRIIEISPTKVEEESSEKQEELFTSDGRIRRMVDQAVPGEGIKELNSGPDGVYAENDNSISQDMISEVEELDDKGSKDISNNNLPGIQNGTSQEVENIDEKVVDSLNDEQTDESITVNDGNNLDKSEAGKLENNFGSVINELNLKELVPAVVYEEEKASEEANTNDGEVVTSGMPSQQKKVSELQITCELMSEEEVEKLQQKSNNKEENPNKEDIIDACLGASDTDSNKPGTAEVRHLSIQGIEEEKEISRNNEQKDKDAQLVNQMDKVTMSETYVKVPEQQISTMSENGSTELNGILKDEIKEEEDICTSLLKEELEDDPQKKAEETTDIAVKGKYLEQVTQMKKETMGDTLHGNGISFDNNMKEAFTTIVTSKTIESDSKDEAISSNKHIKEQDIGTSLQKDNLDNEPREKQEEKHEAIKEVKNTEPVSQSQMCIETMVDNVSADDASIDITKNMQEASDIVAEEHICSITEDESLEVMPISATENKKERDIDDSPPREELEDEPQKKKEISNEENDNTISQDMESEVEELKDKGSKPISVDNLPAESSIEENTDESITINDGDNLDKSKAGKHENSCGSVTNELNLEELARAVVHGEDKISKKANTIDGEVVTSGMPSQEKEGSELNIACELISEEKIERLEQKNNNKEENQNKEETIGVCLGASDTGFNKPDTAEVRDLSSQGVEEEEGISRNNEQESETLLINHDKDAELVDQMDRVTVGETLYAASPGNNMQETYVRVPEQQCQQNHALSKNGSSEVNAILKDEEKVERGIDTSLSKEELEDDKLKGVEKTTAIAEEDKYLEQITQTDIETTVDTLYGNGDSFDNNMQEAVTTLVQEQSGGTMENDSKNEAISSNEHIKEQDIDTSLQKDTLHDDPGKKEEENHEAIREVKITEPVSQMCIANMGDNLSVDNALIDKNMQEASNLVVQEQICIITEDESIEVMPISTNENKREQDIDKSPPKEELEDEAQKKEEITHEEISDMVTPDGGEGGGKCEADLNKNFDDCPSSHVLDEETKDGEPGQAHEEGPNSTYEDQIHPATYTTDDREVDAFEEEMKTENFKTVPGSPAEAKHRKETDSSNATEVENSTNNYPNAVILGDADLNEDKTTSIIDEENQNTDEGDSYGSQTVVETTFYGETDEQEEASKTENEQIYQPEGNTGDDICTEKADAREFESITEPEANDHRQEDNNEAEVTPNSTHNDNINKVIPEIAGHNDPETAAVENEHTLKKGIGNDSDTQVLVSEAANDVVAEKHEITLEITNDESIKEVVLQERENKGTDEEPESDVIDKAINIDEDEKSLSARINTGTAATPRPYLVETVEEKVYELESSDKLENTIVFDIRHDKVPMQEEGVDTTLETTLRVVNAYSGEVINRSHIEGYEGATTDTDLESIGFSGTYEHENATTEVANIDQNEERYDDDTKNRMTENDNTISEDMESEVEELEDKGSKAISDDNLPGIRNETNQEVENRHEKAAYSSNEDMTDESITLNDNADDNLDKSKAGKLENSSGSVTNELNLGELARAVVCGEDKISEEANTNDGEVVTSGMSSQENEGSELYITRELISEVERLELKSNNKEENLNKKEIIDGCLGASNTGSNKLGAAEVRHLSLQGIEEEEEISRNNEQDKDADLVDQTERVAMSETLYAASPGNYMQDTYVKVPEQQIHPMSKDGTTEVNAILKDEKEEEEAEDIHTSLPKEEQEDGPLKKVEKTTAISEEDKYLEQVTQTNIELTDDTSYGNGVSFDNKMQEATATIVQEQTGRTIESDSKDEAISCNEHIKEQDIDISLLKKNLEDEPHVKMEETHEAIEEVTVTEPVSQICIEAIIDISSADDASIDKNMQEAYDGVAEEEICKITEDESSEVMVISKIENKGEQDINKSPPKEKLKDEPQKEEEITHDEDASVVIAEEQLQGLPEDDSVEVREISKNEHKEEYNIHTSSEKEEVEDEPQEKKEESKDMDEKFSLQHISAKGKDFESVSQVIIETIDATLHTNDASFDKNIQQASVVFGEDQIPYMSKDDSVELREIPKTENKQDDYICSVPQKVEVVDEQHEKEVLINAGDEEDIDVDAIPEMNIKRMDNILHAGNASFEKNTAPVVVAEGRVHSMPEDDNIDVEAAYKNKNKEEDDIHSSLPREDREFEPQEKDEEINAQDKEAEDVIHQMGMETNAKLYASSASSENNMQNIRILVVEEQVHNVPKSDGVEEKAIPENENKEEQDIRTNLSTEKPEHELKEKEEEANDTCEEVKNVVMASQADINIINDTFYDNDAPFDKNMQEVFVVDSEENIHSMPENDNIEVMTVPKNIQASLLKEETDVAPDEKQNEEEIKQKPYDISNLTMTNGNKSFKDKETIENSSEKEKLENQETESLHLVLEDLEKVYTTEDIHEVETKKNTVKNNEDKVWKEQDMILVESILESAPDNQNSKPSCTTEEAISGEEILKATSLINGITEVTADNEGSQPETVTDAELYVTPDLVQESTQLQKETTELEFHKDPEQSGLNITQNEETAERGESLNINSSFVGQEMSDETKNIEKDIVYKENASEVTYAMIHEDETEANTSNKPAVDTLLNHQIKEYNHPSPKQNITVADSSEDVAPSSVMAPLAEETNEDAGEKFSRISNYWPKQDTEEASNVNASNRKHPKEMRGVVEGLTEAEKPACASSGSISTYERDVKGEEVVFLATASELIENSEETKKAKEVTKLVPIKEANEKTSSANELKDDEENLHEPFAGQEPEVNQPEAEKEDKEMDNVKFSDLQSEERKQMALRDLPVSQFLLKRILQEQDDAKGARDDEYKDIVNEQDEEGKEKVDEALKTKEITFPVSTAQPIKETSTAQSEVEAEKLENNSASVQEEEGCDVNENSEIPPTEDGETLQNSPDDSTSILVVAAGEKDEVNTPVSKALSDIASKESMVLVSTGPSILESKMDTEEYRDPDSAQDGQDHASVSEENLKEKENYKDYEGIDHTADNSYFTKAAEKDILQKGGEQIKELQLQIQKLEDFCTEPEGQSTIDDQQLKEVADIVSEVANLKSEEVKQDTENQEQVLKSDTNEELKPSQSHEAQQSYVDVRPLQIAQKFPEGNESAVSLAKKHNAETTKEEEDERPPKQSGLNATTAVEAKDAELEPLEKSDQTSKFSHPSPVNDNKLREAMEIEPAVKDSQSDEEKQEATGGNQVKILKDDLIEELKLSELRKVKQSDLSVEPAKQQLNTPENISNEEHTVQTTHLHEDEDITDVESDEKEEEDTQKAEESAHDTTIAAETRDEVELKPAQKKSHGILSGVGSKVKNSIAKVKKAIKGKNSHSKAPTTKQ